jgi:hypothetical protein
MSILLFLVAVLLVVQITDPFNQEESDTEEPANLLDAEIGAQGDPYEYTVVACGEGWTSSSACQPRFGEDSVGRIEFLHLRALEYYRDQTIESPEAWLVPEEGDARPRIRLEARGDGHNYSFSVSRRHSAWDDFWGDGRAFSVSLVVAPRGAELVSADELTYLRRSIELEMDGSAVVSERTELEESPAGATEEALEPSESVPGVPGLWAWHNIGSRHQATYHVGRQSFSGTLEVSGGTTATGKWRLEYRATDNSSPFSMVVADPALRRGKVDLAQGLTRLMRESAVVASLEKESTSAAASVVVMVFAPGEAQEQGMMLNLALEGAAAASSVKHRVCVMLSGPDGTAPEGQARMSTQGEMRMTFKPNSAGKMECADGGNSGRWTEATFGPEQTELRFVYLGGAPEAEAARGKEQYYPIPPEWTSTNPSCVAITVHLDLNGWQAKPPTFNALYRLIDGRCQSRACVPALPRESGSAHHRFALQ